MELNQLKGELENIKRGLEKAKRLEVDFGSIGAEALQVLYNFYCDGSYEDSLFCYLKYQPPSVIENNKPIIEQCKKLLGQIKELTSFLLQRAKNSMASQISNQKKHLQDNKKLNIESIDAIKIIQDVIYGQANKNDSLNPEQRKEFSDSISLSEIKMDLKQLILAFDRDQIDIMTGFGKLTKYYPFITKNDVNKDSLSDVEQDLVLHCLKLTKKLIDKIKIRYKNIMNNL